jgi:hypothetical protein
MLSSHVKNYTPPPLQLAMKLVRVVLLASRLCGLELGLYASPRGRRKERKEGREKIMLLYS